MYRFKLSIVLVCILGSLLYACTRNSSQSDLAGGFEDPSDSVKPWTYWFFIMIISRKKASTWTWMP